MAHVMAHGSGGAHLQQHRRGAPLFSSSRPPSVVVWGSSWPQQSHSKHSTMLPPPRSQQQQQQEWEAAGAAAEASTTAAAAAPPPPASSNRQQRQQQQQWDYKYRRYPCPSPCPAGDLKCAKLEALVQNVLAYPHLPASVARRSALLSDDLDATTALVEAMADHFGKELTLWFVRKQPRILVTPAFDDLTQRCDALRALLALAPLELPLLLRKNPNLLALAPDVVAERHRALHAAVPFGPPGVRALVLKCPLVLNFMPATLAAVLRTLRTLSSTRDDWARDYDEISPSLLAFYVRDHGDLRRRLEYLAATGEAPDARLRDVFKPSNKLFASKHRGFARWCEMLARRAAAAEAAEARAALLEASAAQEGGRAGGGGSGAGSS